MDLALGMLKLHSMNIFDISPEDVIDVFAFKKLGMKKLQEMGHTVLPGDDVENIMLRYFYADKTVFDRYTRTKLGKKPRLTEHEEHYAKQLLGFMNKDNVLKLLKLCRLSSYLGGPGSPDYIGNKTSMTQFFYIGDEFFGHQQLFMFLALLAGFEVQVLPVTSSMFSIDTQDLLNYMLSHEKSAKQQAAIEQALAPLKEEIMTKQVLDAISYLEEEKSILPFAILKKWIAHGRASKEDLFLLFERIDYILEKRDREFKNYIQKLKDDKDFIAFGPARDEATMRKKAAYLEQKFGICDVKSKDLLNFV